MLVREHDRRIDRLGEKNMKTGLIAFVLALCAHVPCIAAVTYVSQWRDVEASDPNAGYDWVWATDFAPFSAHIIGSGADFRLDHESRIDPTRITFDGSARGAGGSRSGGFWFQVLARSQIDIEFTVDEPTPFNALITASGSANWSLDAFLESSPAGTTYFSGAGAFDGVLQPGSYRYFVRVRGQGTLAFDPDSGAELSIPGIGNVQAVLNIPGSPTAALLLSGLLPQCARRRRGSRNWQLH